MSRKQPYQLRPWNFDDLNRLIEIADNREIAKYMMDSFPHPYTREAGERFIGFAINENPQRIFAIEMDGQVAGSIGIHPLPDIQCRNAELGYWLAQEYWGRGILTAAVKEIIPIAFNLFPINRLFARPFGTNTASQRVLEKAGFHLEARIKNGFYKFGAYDDELVYAIRREELS